MLLKRKRCRKSKTRGYANNNPQKEHISKEKSSSPKVSLYALIWSYVTGTLNDGKVIMINVHEAFLQGDWSVHKIIILVLSYLKG